MQGTGDSKAPDTRARDQRIEAHLDLVKSMAGDIGCRPLGRGIDLDDLVGYGTVGLVEAATRFEERGVPFSAFARRRIYGAIVDGIRGRAGGGRGGARKGRLARRLPRAPARLRWWEEAEWWESGGKCDLDSDHLHHVTVATHRYDLAFRERDIGFEPTTFSLGKRKRPFRAVTGSAK